MWQQQGFLQGNEDIDKSMQKLAGYIESIPVKYRQFSENDLLYKASPAKWSKQEILGHLIDSATNNLKRFCEIQFSEKPYRVISYRQNELVEVNNYQQLPLEHLLQLWQSLNRQIIFVVKNIPIEKLEFPVDPQYDNQEMKTLGWVIGDYVAHMEHHFRQVFGEKQF